MDDEGCSGEGVMRGLEKIADERGRLKKQLGFVVHVEIEIAKEIIKFTYHRT